MGFHETVNSLAQQLHGFARNDFFHEIPHHFCINTKPVVDEIENSFEIYIYIFFAQNFVRLRNLSQNFCMILRMYTGHFCIKVCYAHEYEKLKFLYCSNVHENKINFNNLLHFIYIVHIYIYINVELTSTFLLYRGLVHHHHWILNLPEPWLIL